MNRSQLAHVLRAACEITGDPHVLVIGSQAILGSFDDRELPTEATQSIEVDVAFLDDPQESKSDLVDGGIGEASLFHETYGVYGQGVGVTTAVLPSGWRDRLVTFSSDETGAAEAVCLDPHDLVISKLVAARTKDHAFAYALIDAGLVDLDELKTRADLLDVVPAIRRRVVDWLSGIARS